MIDKILGVLAIIIIFCILAGALWQTSENEVAKVVAREALPSMERVGEVEVNNKTVYLWAFDFEGRRCLWGTTFASRSATAGLTCWKKEIE